MTCSQAMGLDDLLAQQRCGRTGAKGRLRREDCKFVKHDKLFSKWKILVGPSDSTEQTNSAGKVGIARYHVHNLPATEFGPGVYELGVTAPWSQVPDNQRARALKREDVIAVYIGHAANIWQRLQKYGLAGAHLEPGSTSSKLQGDSDSVGSRSPERIAQSGFSGELAKSAGSGPRMFSKVFALGSSVAFRWAHSDSKVVAEQVESELLAVFNYAWNKGTSGTRRSRDILAKLFMAWPTNMTSFSWLGLQMALRKPQDTTTSTNSSRSMTSNFCFFMTMQPQGRIKVASLDLRCGVLTGKGKPCNAPPLRGRKHCLQHYEVKRLRGVTPASASPSPSVSTTKQVNMGRTKLQTVPVKAKSCHSKGFLGRELFFSTKTKTYCKEAEAKEEKPVERRRHNSLSFNTWVKGETDQRVHDSSDMNKSTMYVTSFQKPAENQDSGMRATSSTSLRLQLLESKYASVPNNDSKRR